MKPISARTSVGEIYALDSNHPTYLTYIIDFKKSVENYRDGSILHSGEEVKISGNLRRPVGHPHSLLQLQVHHVQGRGIDIDQPTRGVHRMPADLTDQLNNLPTHVKDVLKHSKLEVLRSLS